MIKILIFSILLHLTVASNQLYLLNETITLGGLSGYYYRIETLSTSGILSYDFRAANSNNMLSVLVLDAEDYDKFILKRCYDYYSILSRDVPAPRAYLPPTPFKINRGVPYLYLIAISHSNPFSMFNVSVYLEYTNTVDNTAVLIVNGFTLLMFFVFLVLGTAELFDFYNKTGKYQRATVTDQ